MPNNPVTVLDNKYVGQTPLEKYKNIFSKVSADCNLVLVSTLDDIAWALNLRGTDIEFNPIFFSYLILHRNGETFSADLFADKDVTSIADYLAQNNITVRGYNQIFERLDELGQQGKTKIATDMNVLSQRLSEILVKNNYEVEDK